MINKSDNDILSSVLMITYNHEKYISHAIESILNQITEFNFELVIGEDCSTDKTKEIILKYQKDNPGRIKLFSSVQNIGMRENFLKTLISCNGRYIAICEGDDFWVDPYKLQKQTDFLETNPDYGLIYTDTNFRIEKGAEKIYPKEYLEFKNLKYYEGFVWDRLMNGNFINNLTVVFRRDAFPLNKIDKRFNNYFLDYWIWIIISSFHKVKYLDYKSSVYRVHPNGATANYQEISTHHQLLSYIVLKYYLRHYPGKKIPKPGGIEMLRFVYRSIFTKETNLNDKCLILILFLRFNVKCIFSPNRGTPGKIKLA
jgi:glycosyltransferase involved in cell wall biosynthesis